MNILRKMLVIFLAGLFPLFLFALAVDAGVIRAAGSSGPVKKILADSGVYNSIVSGALDQAKTSGSSGSGISLSNPSVKAAAENTITPAYVQQNTEKVLDSVYAWLDGKTATPDFSIDVSAVKATFAVEAGKAARAQAASLPKCTAKQASSNSSFDPFSATCLPAGMTPAQAAAIVQNDIASGQGFLKKPVITADNVKSGSSSQSVFNDQLKNAPQAYQKIKKTPIILAVLSLLTTLGVIFLSASLRRGLRRAGTTLLVVGIIVLIFAWVLNYAVNQKALPKITMDNKVLQEKVRILAKDLTQNLDKTYYMLGGVYAALGVLAIGIPMFIGRGRNKHMQPERTAETPEPAHKEAPPEHKPEPAKKTKIKIQ